MTTTEQQAVQIQTFLGYEHAIDEAIQNAQKSANAWLAYNRLTREQVEIQTQTVAEVIPSREHIFYLHIITVIYNTK